jgi:hypothetical protein
MIEMTNGIVLSVLAAVATLWRIARAVAAEGIEQVL